MVDIDAEYLYVKQILRLYEIIATQRIQIGQMKEVLNKGKKEPKTNVGKHKLSNSNN